MEATKDPKSSLQGAMEAQGAFMLNILDRKSFVMQLLIFEMMWCRKSRTPTIRESGRLRGLTTQVCTCASEDFNGL